MGISFSNIAGALLAGLFGTIGDLISRVFLFNCSVDSIWTLLLALPPFSFFSGYMYATGKIKAGERPCKESLDLFLVLIPVLVITLAVLLPKLIKASGLHLKKTLRTIVIACAFVVMFAMVRVYKYNEVCKSIDTNNNFQMVSYPVKGLLTAMVTVGAATFITYLCHNDFITSIPLIGLPATILGAIDEEIPGTVAALVLTGAHLVCNLNENSSEYIRPICAGNMY